MINPYAIVGALLSAITFCFPMNRETIAYPRYQLDVSVDTYHSLQDATILSSPVGGAAVALDDLSITRILVMREVFDLTAGARLIVLGNGGINLVRGDLYITASPMLSYYDTTNSNSTISYRIEEVSGSEVLKIEWEHGILFGSDTTESVDFQLWLYPETGVMEFRYGPNSLPKNYFFPGFAVINRLFPPFEVVEERYMVSGDPTDPTFEWDTSTTADISALLTFPPVGTVYRFTPLTSSSHAPGDIAATDFSVSPLPADTYLRVALGEAFEEGMEIRMIDLAGRTVFSGEVRSSRMNIDLRFVPPGIYVVEVSGRGRVFRKSVPVL